ncbi:chemotaxis protein CheB [Roseinatronobacter alkalisoli]|uniref:histidine kinase n=1 Tax=Roseinatronobacter alkalisoli TaxID=3028235 RepID=A0ABT5TEL8_9RHOB|nr:chemotaxis protein CheB [Roseinatronobacter sp. HJB301]MDD7972348.1 chemotaxis protein CheB [Roseinatronobacter sp. HJB301]
MSEHEARTGLPVIAIGASAGGLEASRALLKELPGDVQAAFILILHLDPSHDSMMVDLLANHTKLKVVQAADGMTLQAGYLYVIPPGVFLTVAQRTMCLTAPDGGKSVRLPYDVLLRSLAKDAAELSGCIVLSGTGSDGSLGIADIHAAGGLVIAQDPEDAGYPGMPESAIATGFVARTLPASQMVAALEQFAGRAPHGISPAKNQLPEQHDTADPASIAPAVDYRELLSFLDDHTTQDIALYKPGTLERRIGRRMAMVGLGAGEVARYLDILKADADERAQLSADLLIHVTSFFRDPGVFEHLSARVVPDLLAGLAADQPLRVWVAGCSTGEEAYSLAMTFTEVMENIGSKAGLQILASDIDPDAITAARAGFFTKDIEADVSPERLARFFVPENGGWRVTSALRDQIVFTVADLLSDPPFSRIDLVSCRNVLIYLGPEAQKRVIARCCFALRQGGLLLLGSAEMPGQGDTCFAVADKDSRLWQRVGKSHTGDLHFAAGKREETALMPGQTLGRRNSLADLCRRLVLENYAPAAALLNAQLDCVYLLGPTEKYLKVSQGHLGPGILGMLPKSLRVRFRAAVASCKAGNPLARVTGGRISGTSGFDIALHTVSGGPEPLFLACFIDVVRARPETSGSDAAAAQDRQKSDLEADLEATRSDLSDALRDLEDEVEAHGADRAEALSINEEFQSTNEELLASKEELQSLNEELTALNSQLQETLERHRITANDLQNVLFSTDVATLFLDLDLNIRFFTPATRAIFRLIASDIGRPLADLASVTRDDDPTEDARAVLRFSEPIEREIAGADAQWFLRRVQPYRAEGGHFEGVVITYVDITERKSINAALVAATLEADRATRAKSRFLASASHDLRQPMQAMALLNALIARHKRSSEGARLTALLDQTLTSMTAMLDSMLDVNRIDSGVVRPVMRPVAIAPLLQRLEDEFAPQCELKRLKLRSVPCTAWVQTDPQLLEQMLRNLLSNALKYTLDGGILLGCRRRGTSLTVQVYDTGIGVPKSETSTIFDAYHQGSEVQALAGHGLGLGLSIVQRLGKLMDHPVDVRSKPGKGSAFMVTLPIVEAAPDEALPVQQSLAAAPPAVRHGVILLVEDEGPLRELLKEYLVKEGHTVIAHANAKDALSWASDDAAQPDLLLTDYDLRGGTSGLRLAQDLPDVLGNAVPTIMLTGDITAETLKAIGATDFRQVTKPVMPQVLLALISDMLQATHRARSRKALRTDASDSTVHVVDDDPMIRETMRRLFEAEGWNVICHASAEDFLALPRPDSVACLLVDAILPGMSGVDLLTLLQTENSQMPAVMLTGHGDAAMAVAGMKAGASDLIEKPASAAELLASVRHAVRMARNGPARTGSRKIANQRFAKLTARERQVLAHVLAGEPNKIIAADLGINQRTVENHRAAVMRKTGAASLPALVRMALAADVQEA